MPLLAPKRFLLKCVMQGKVAKRTSAQPVLSRLRPLRCRSNAHTLQIYRLHHRKFPDRRQLPLPEQCRSLGVACQSPPYCEACPPQTTPTCRSSRRAARMGTSNLSEDEQRPKPEPEAWLRAEKRRSRGRGGGPRSFAPSSEEGFMSMWKP